MRRLPLAAVAFGLGASIAWCNQQQVGRSAVVDKGWIAKRTLPVNHQVSAEDVMAPVPFDQRLRLPRRSDVVGKYVAEEISRGGFVTPEFLLDAPKFTGDVVLENLDDDPVMRSALTPGALVRVCAATKPDDAFQVGCTGTLTVLAIHHDASGKGNWAALSSSSLREEMRILTAEKRRIAFSVPGKQLDIPEIKKE
jgi:hypothetical protein